MFVRADGADDPKIKRIVYMFQGSNSRIIIHYKGNDSEIAHTKHMYVATCPSVLRELKFHHRLLIKEELLHPFPRTLASAATQECKANKESPVM